MTPEEHLTLEDNPQRASREFTGSSRRKTSLFNKSKTILRTMTVEPICFCAASTESLLVLCTRVLALEKTCRVNLALDQEICDALTARNDSYPNYTMNVETVQKYSSLMMIWNNVFQSLFPVLLLFFAGSWSDKHKRRKFCVLMPLTGEIVMTLIYLLSIFYFYELPLEVGIVADTAMALTGGWSVMSMGIYTYISGITSTENRTTRIGMMNTIQYISFCIGLALSGILFEEMGFYGVYSFAFILYSSALVYGLIHIKDIRDIEIEKGIYEKCRTKKNFLLDFFDLGNVRNTFSVCFKKGPNNRRARVCAVMVLSMIVMGPAYGELNISYFFTRYKYGWDSVDASIFVLFQYMATTVGILLSLTIFTKFLKLNDAILGVISNSSKILGSIVLAIAPTPLWYYVGAVVQIFNGAAVVAMKSYASKFIPEEELGQLNSLLCAIEAVTVVVYGPLYNRIYVATIDVFPGGFYIAGAIMTIPGIFLFMFLYIENQKDQKQEKLHKQQEEHLLRTGENEIQKES